jgi:hypothetical protein
MKITDSARGSAAIYRLDHGNQRTQDSVAESARATPLVFVTGAMRSGTATLARMLGAHSAVMSFNPLHYFGALCDPRTAELPLEEHELAELAALILARQNHGLWGQTPTAVERAWGRQVAHYLDEADCNGAGLYAAVMRRLGEDGGKTFACDQTPRNIFHAERLLELYENAHIFHVVRDPRAVLASQKSRGRFNRIGSDGLTFREVLRQRVHYHPLTMSKLWAKATESAMHLMGHPRFLAVRFEDLIANPDATARRLCATLGVNFEPGMIQMPRWASTDAEYASEREDAAYTTANRWRGHLSRSEALICEQVTHRMMQRFGYPLEYMGRAGKPASLPSLISYPLHVAGVIAMDPVRALSELSAGIARKR